MSRTYRKYWDSSVGDYAERLEYYKNSKIHRYTAFDRMERVFKQKALYRIRKKRKPFNGKWPDGKLEIMSTPGWWNKERNEVPFRADNRNQCKKILNGSVDPEDVEFRHTHRKPHIYYW